MSDLYKNRFKVDTGTGNANRFLLSGRLIARAKPVVIRNTFRERILTPADAGSE